jgi:Carbohydrate binding domain
MNHFSPVKCLLLLAAMAGACLTIPSFAADPSTPPAPPPAASLISNGGFEDGITGWGTYVPDESKAANCRFDVSTDAPHSGANCARFQTDDFGRFSIGSAMIPVQPGEHYHVSVWIKAGSLAEVRPKAQGFVIRLHLSQSGVEAAGGHLYIAPGNRVTRDAPADPVSDSLPTTWTQIEAVIEIPQGVDSMGPGIFSWWTKGTVYADDFSVEKVDASTPVTPFWQKGGTPPANASK